MIQLIFFPEVLILFQSEHEGVRIVLRFSRGRLRDLNNNSNINRIINVHLRIGRSWYRYNNNISVPIVGAGSETSTTTLKWTAQSSHSVSNNKNSNIISTPSVMAVTDITTTTFTT